jgi:hypothetical protein
MGAELDRAARSSRRRYLALGWSVAAAILIAIGGYAYLRSHSDGAAPHVNASPVVEDRIMIAVSGAATTTEKPLVRLDEYRSLFTD